jgi:O-antigen/teichoic acid export membrane protein
MSKLNQVDGSEQALAERNKHFFETETVRANLKAKSIRGAASLLTSGGANFALSLAATSVLARILMPADFGLLGMVFALTAVAERFKDIGLGRATVQKKEVTHSEVSNLFWLNVSVGAGLCLSIAMLSGVIARFYHEQKLTYVAMALSTTFLFAGLTIQHQALLNRRMRFMATGTIGTSALAASNLCAIILALKGYGYWALVWREILKSVFTAIATWVSCPWVPGLPDRKTNVSQQMRFARDITFFNIVTYFTNSLDQMLLGRFWGAVALGLYRQAFQLTMTPMDQVTSPMHGVSEPLFSSLQDDEPKYRRIYEKTVSTLSLITMPVAAGVFVCSKQIVLLVLGQRWSSAADIVRILAVAAFIKPAISTIGIVMVTCGKTARYAIIGFLDSIALVVAISVGVKWGARGIAIGHVLVTYIVFLPFVWWAFKGTPVRLSLWLRAIARPAICSLLMVAILSILSGFIRFQKNLTSLSLLVPLGIVCYSAAMLALPGGRRILSALLRDCQSALGKRRELRPDPVSAS